MIAAAAEDDDSRVFRSEVVDHHILPANVADGAFAIAAIYKLGHTAECILAAQADRDGGLAFQFDDLGHQAEGVLTGAGESRTIQHIAPQQNRFADAQQVDLRGDSARQQQRQVSAVAAAQNG